MTTQLFETNYSSKMSIGTTDDTADRVQGLMDELRKPEVACLTNSSGEDEKLLMSLLCGPSPDSSAAKSTESSGVYCSDKSTPRKVFAKKPTGVLIPDKPAGPAFGRGQRRSTFVDPQLSLSCKPILFS